MAKDIRPARNKFGNIKNTSPPKENMKPNKTSFVKVVYCGTQV